MLHNVVQFFKDDTYEYVVRNVPAAEAAAVVRRCITSVAGRTGLVKRVIITDLLDCTNLEWEFGKGIVFPPELQAT